MRNTIRRDFKQTGRSDTFIKKHEKAEIRQPADSYFRAVS